MKTFLFLLLIAVLFCCEKDASLYSESDKQGYHVIDLKSFSLETPDDYKFIRKQGYDSFVGKISNGEISFHFSNGCHIWEGPRDKYDYIERHRDYLSFLQTTYYLERVVDISPFKTGDALHVTKLSEAITNVELLKDSDSISLIPIIHPSSGYYHRFTYQDSVYHLPFPLDESRFKANENRYQFLRDTISESYRKIWVDKNPSDTMTVGLYTVHLLDYKESMHSPCNKLGMAAYDVPANRVEEVMSILRSVRVRPPSE